MSKFDGLDLSDLPEANVSTPTVNKFEGLDLSDLPPATEEPKAVLNQAMDVVPDTQAKAKKIATELNAPLDVIASDLPSFEKDAALKRIDLEKTPATAKFLSNYDNATLAHDDIESLQGMEEVFDFARPFRNIVESTTLGIKNTLLGAGAYAVDYMSSQMLSNMTEEDLKNVGFESKNQLVEQKKQFEEGIQKTIKDNQALQSELDPKDLSVIEQGVRSGAQSFAQNLPVLATAMVSAPAAIGTAMSMSFATSYGDARANGLSEDDAANKAGIDAAIEGITEFLPTKALTKLVTGAEGDLSKEVIKFAIQDMGGEQLATLGQSINDYQFGTDDQITPETPLNTALEIQGRRQAITAFATLFSAGPQLAVATGANTILNQTKTIVNAQKEQSDRELKDEDEQARIDKIDEIVVDSKLHKRDTETFKQSVTESDGDKNTQIYIDSLKAGEYIKDKDINDPAIKMLSDKVNATPIPGDIAIPIADFASVIAGSEHFKPLRDLMVMSPEVTAAFEKEQRIKESQVYVKNMMEETKQNASDYVDAQKIYETVKDQLVNTGTVSPDNAKALAQIVPAWATVYAKRNGLTVKEVYENSGLKIEGDKTPASKPKVTEEQIAKRFEPKTDRRVQEQTPVTEQRVADRRTDEVRRQNFSQMSDEEKFNAVYSNVRTGIQNVKAFNEDVSKSSVVVSIDADSLKTINDNLGHSAGDELLQKVANILHNTSNGNAYHVSGDEFYLLGNNEEEIKSILKTAQDLLGKEVIENKKGVLPGLEITFGIGKDKDSADEAMEQSKKDREAAGERAGRGELPKRFVKKDILEQDDRGYYDPANAIIRLSQASDLSTFLHEFSHFMYEMELKIDSDNTKKINEWFLRNVEDVAKEAGESVADATNFIENKTTGDAAKDANLRRATHEQFARGFEAYIMKGEAPSVELRNVFKKFARWLTEIYKLISQLNVKLDTEIQQVFDRLIASEEQIALAQTRMQYKPLFDNVPKAETLTKKVSKKVPKESQDLAEDTAVEILRDKLIKELTRQKTQWWKEEKDVLINQEIEKLKGEKVYKTGATIKNKMKLDHSIVRDMLGKERIDKRGIRSIRIPRELQGLTITGGTGASPDAVAPIFGYSSGEEMLKDLVESPSITDQATTNAQKQMIEKYGDMMNDGSIKREADEAVHNFEKAKQLLTELKELRKGFSLPDLEPRMLEDFAEEAIGKLSFREIQPNIYRKAEIKAAQESAVFLTMNKKEEAAAAKTRQLMNFYLFNEATKAQKGITKIVEHKARYAKKEIQNEIQKAENGYWEQILKILNRFEFRKSATLKSVDQINENVNTWMAKRNEEDGDALILSPAVLDETYVTHWKNVKYSDLQGVDESIKNIEHVARYANKITRLGEEMDFKQLVDTWTEHLEKENNTIYKPSMTDTIDASKKQRFDISDVVKISYLMKQLDGEKDVGMSHEIIFQPMTDAAFQEQELWGSVGLEVSKAIDNRSKEDKKRHAEKYFIPELNDSLYGHQILAVGLNVGNTSNMKKMLRGEGWAKNDSEVSFENPKLKALLDRLTKSDWELIQLIWDKMNELYPKLAEVHRKTTGQTPPKVKGASFTYTNSKTGKAYTMAGGYYPMKYDPARDNRARQNEERENNRVESMFSTIGSIQASVNASATNERTSYFAPVRLNLDVVTSHFQETIHYITHHDAVREVNKLINNQKVADTIRAKVGPKKYSQLKPWLNNVAKDGKTTQTKGYVERALGHMRFGVTLGTMGFKAGTGFKQLIGLSNTAKETGSIPLMKALRNILGSPENMNKAWQFAVDNSKVMKYRSQTMDREIKNVNQKLRGKTGWTVAVQETSMKHIALIQTYTVDLPSWYAGYIKAMGEHGDEQKAFDYADWVVESIQGSGATKDLSAVMANQNEVYRSLTMFMTAFSSMWNQQASFVRKIKRGDVSPTSIAAQSAFLWILPVLLDQIIDGDFNNDDEPEEVLQKTLTKIALLPTAGLPLVRDVANASIGEYDYNASPIFSFLTNGIKATKSINTAMMSDKEVTQAQLKQASKFIGAIAGVPGTGQAWNTYEHIQKVIEEGEDLTATELLLGPKK